MNGVRERKCALVQRGGRGGDLECRGVGSGQWGAAGIAHEGRQFGHQGGEAVRRRTVGEAMGHRLIVSRRRTRGHPSSTDKSVAGGANM